MKAMTGLCPPVWARGRPGCSRPLCDFPPWPPSPHPRERAASSRLLTPPHPSSALTSQPCAVGSHSPLVEEQAGSIVFLQDLRSRGTQQSLVQLGCGRQGKAQGCQSEPRVQVDREGWLAGWRAAWALGEGKAAKGGRPGDGARTTRRNGEFQRGGRFRQGLGERKGLFSRDSL